MSKPGGRPAVRMYTTRWCPYCIRARSLLKDKGVAFEDIAVDGDPERRLTWQGGGRTVPQIFVHDQPVGGYDELAALERDGRLDALLAGAGAPDRNN